MTHRERTAALAASLRASVDAWEKWALGEDPIDPPPPPAPSKFFEQIALKDEGGSRARPGETKSFIGYPDYNVHGQSFGVSFKFKPEAHPSRWAILALWDGNNPQWMLKTDGAHMLHAAFGLSDQKTYTSHDCGLAFVGEWHHVVIGFDARTLTGTCWLNGLTRHFFTLQSGIGWKPGETPPLTINSTEAGHESGDLTTGELVYAVGACPTQSDVDRLGAGV
jgi:hypothetical protein